MSVWYHTTGILVIVKKCQRKDFQAFEAVGVEYSYPTHPYQILNAKTSIPLFLLVVIVVVLFNNVVFITIFFIFLPVVIVIVVFYIPFFIVALIIVVIIIFFLVVLIILVVFFLLVFIIVVVIVFSLVFIIVVVIIFSLVFVIFFLVVQSSLDKFQKGTTVGFVVGIFPNLGKHVIWDHHGMAKCPFLVNVPGIRQIFEKEGISWKSPYYRGFLMVCVVVGTTVLTVVYPFNDSDQIGILPKFSNDATHGRFPRPMLHLNPIFRKIPATAIQLNSIQSIIPIVFGSQSKG
mmetsp:Transcript_2891/g.6203  ORF Transcript_2891/g.6203 Transcript_2891/m.6203 type:complete len:290 (-) Transcript_2891:1838-2707(-)